MVPLEALLALDVPEAGAHYGWAAKTEVANKPAINAANKFPASKAFLSVNYGNNVDHPFATTMPVLRGLTRENLPLGPESIGLIKINPLLEMNQFEIEQTGKSLQA